MAALVRRDGVPADTGKISRLYNSLDIVDETNPPRTARLGLAEYLPRACERATTQAPAERRA